MIGCLRRVIFLMLLGILAGGVFLIYSIMNPSNRTSIPLPDAQPVPCDAVLPFVRTNLEASCLRYPDDYNSACYGNSHLTAHFQNASVDPSTFDERGEFASLTSLQRLDTAPYNPDTYEWGIGVLRLDALLEGTVSGRNVTMVLYGDTSLSADTDTDDIPEGSETLATLSEFPAFYFSTRAGSPHDCNVLPNGGVLLDTPDDIHVTFTANGVDIDLASTAILEASGTQMIVSVLDGRATVTVNRRGYTVNSLQEITIVMDSTGRNPLRFSSGPRAMRRNRPELGAVCQIAAALNLTFPCRFSQQPTPTATRTPRGPTPTPTRTPRVPAQRICEARVNTTGNLIVRASPGGSRVTQIGSGEIVEVQDQSMIGGSETCSLGLWYNVDYGGGEGWVCAQLLDLQSGCSALGYTLPDIPIVQPPVVTPEPIITDTWTPSDTPSITPTDLPPATVWPTFEPPTSEPPTFEPPPEPTFTPVPTVDVPG